MAIKRYISNSDNTITNAYQQDLKNRGTGSNMGASDVVEVFSLYAQRDSGSAELSRALFKFPTDTINSDRTAGNIPASGSVKFYLRLYNAKHAFTLPRSFTLTVQAVSSSWEEGTGLDMEEYTDLTYDGSGSNWLRTGKGSSWTTIGGDYHTNTYSKGTVDGPFPKHNVSFDSGVEDIELNITAMVEEWLASTQPNYGLCVKLTSSQEAYVDNYSNKTVPSSTTVANVLNLTGATRSYFTKKFFSRTTEYFFKRPCVEARWDSSTKDDRGNFYYSSSLAPAEDNLNTLYLYNYVRGRLRNIPDIGTGDIYVSIFSGSHTNQHLGRARGPSGSALKLAVGGGVKTALHTNITGTYVSTGIYSASFAITASAAPLSPLTTLFDVWKGAEDTNAPPTQYHTGTISPKSLKASSYNPSAKHVTSITNLRSKYDKDEKARFRLFVREKDWSPTIYSKATTALQNTIIDSASYQIKRVIDNLNVVSYGTASQTLHTQLSFDVTGNYFDLDMSLLEPGYSYAVYLAYYNGAIGAWVEQDQTFKFRVE
jgi:hypothetical protein